MQTVIETQNGWMIRCRSCGWHEFPKIGKPGANWTFNGNLELPTFTPSLNEAVNWPTMKHYQPDIPSRRCHFIITAGQIQYCGDCTHDLRGQTLPMEPFEEAKVRYYAALKQAEGW